MVGVRVLVLTEGVKRVSFSSIMSRNIVVPPFDGKVKEPIERYHWWSWHPLYPYWSKSCWGGSTKKAAIADLARPDACGMDIYHNKLIREDDGGVLVEVADRPCKRLDMWERCIKFASPIKE